jgi:uncharacterized protein (DUF1810 family)
MNCVQAERRAIGCGSCFHHPVLGRRLPECVEALLVHGDLNALEILGSPDDMKLRSCLKLFSAAQQESALYQKALDQFFSGKPDERTVELLAVPATAE